MKLKLFWQTKLWPFLANAFDGLSHAFNAIVGGKSCESFSGRAYREDNGWLKPIDWFFLHIFKDKDHCKVSHENDLKHCRWLKDNPPKKRK